MKIKILFIAIACSVLLLTLVEMQPASAQGPKESGAQVGKPWRGAPGITETVTRIMDRERSAPKTPATTREIRPSRAFKNLKQQRSSSPNLPRFVTPQSPRQNQTARAPSSPQGIGTSFLGAQSSESGYVPPDSMGAVGPTQILVVVNGRIKSFNKSGTVGSLNTTLTTFFSSVLRSGAIAGDPVVSYDRLTGRWFVTAVEFFPAFTPNRIVLAVSSGSTITDTSSFAFFQFQHDLVGGTNPDSGKEADYDSLGVDKNSLYIGVNIFGTSDSSTTGFVVKKSDLLIGTLTVTAFRQLAVCTGFLVDCSVGPLSPRGVQNDDPNATEGYFIGSDGFYFSVLTMRRITYPGGIPTVSANILVGVPSTTYPRFGVPALDTVFSLDDIDDRLFNAQIHKNKITGASTLWTAHNIEVDSTGVACGPYIANACTDEGRDGSRWYEIGSLTTSPTLVQAGTLYDSAASNPRYYWMPSVTMSGQGHMALGASFASVADYAGIAVSGRLSGDALGATQAPDIAQIGLGSYNLGSQTPKRWGDYSQTVVDPNDDMTMWTFQEYANATDSWGVRAIQLIAPPPATITSLSSTSEPQGVYSTTIVITGTSVSGSGYFDPGPDIGGPGFANRIRTTVTGHVFVKGTTFDSPTQVTVNLNTVCAEVGPQSVTIINPDGQSVTAVGALTITSAPSVCYPYFFPLIFR